MRALALAVALLLAAAGCRSTYHARADDLARANAERATAAEPDHVTLPATDDDGADVSLRVASIVSASPAAADGLQELRAADGRGARTAGWVILGTGLALGLVFVAQGGMGSDVSSMGPILGAMLATPFVLTAAPFLTYGYVVGNPER